MSDIAGKEGMEQTQQKGFFARLKSGLSMSRASFAKGIDNVIKGKAEVGAEMLEELEELLLFGDVGMTTTSFILEELKKGVAGSGVREKEEFFRA